MTDNPKKTDVATEAKSGTEVATTKEQSVTAVFRGQIDKMGPEFKAALPDHIPVDRFKRVVQTAVNQNPDLLLADRRSLFQSCTMAAQDGLLPDGRQAALAIFNTRVKERGKPDVWIQKVQYMPMIAGILQKVRNSAQLSGISANVVYASDDFDYELGDSERIYHKPNLANPGAAIAVYAIAHLKDGMIEREVMSVREVEEVRAVSKSKDGGPWSKWWGEMARKTVLRRLSKRLPMSSDLDTVLRRDDAFYNLDKPDAGPPPARPLRTDYVERISHHPDAKETDPTGGGEADGNETIDNETGDDPDSRDTTVADEPYSLVNWDGEVSEHATLSTFGEAFLKAMKLAPSASELNGMWDSNMEQMNVLRAGDDEQRALAFDLENAFDEHEKALNAKPKADAKPADKLV